ncbi:unnamed protein product [Mortierella alpina]
MHKAYAANKRAKTRTTDMAKLDKELDKLQAKSEMGKWTSTTAMNFINRHINKLFVLTPADKEAMRDGLETSGVPVCLCQTEADVCIARGPDKDVENGPCRKRIAVSIDSDLLVYESISAVLRPMPKHNGYGLYVKSDVLRALDLPCAGHMAVYGIVNENDYGRNVEHLGLARNLDIVRTLPSEGLSEMLEAYWPRELLESSSIPTGFISLIASSGTISSTSLKAAVPRTTPTDHIGNVSSI